MDAHSSCRYCKLDEQLCKKLESLTEAATSYFKWAATHPAHASGPAAEACDHVADGNKGSSSDSRIDALKAFLRFVDGAACYFAPIGVPAKLAGWIQKVAKGFSVEEREDAASSVRWQARNLQGSATLWRDMKPALRSALESASADGVSGGGSEEGQDGGERRKRSRR